MKVAAVQVSSEKCNVQITLGCAVIRRTRVRSLSSVRGQYMFTHVYMGNIILLYIKLNFLNINHNSR